MASRHFTILCFLLFSLAYAQPKNPNPNPNPLIQQECNRTTAPTACLQCLEPDPDSRAADRAGLATVLVKCVVARSKSLLAAMSPLGQGFLAKRDKVGVTVFLVCNVAIDGMALELPDAVGFLAKGDYQGANGVVQGALKYQDACLFLAKSRGRVSQLFAPSLLDEVAANVALSEAFSQIVGMPA
ncbi:unnamed protein product [Linum trigynum]|uniref:Pectinesterase inhibitor domain-containing protein n=1 Tax=Linum trigynum TaxID=586398 RepID=A0AAV2EZ47_9ROSI